MTEIKYVQSAQTSLIQNTHLTEHWDIKPNIHNIYTFLCKAPVAEGSAKNISKGYIPGEHIAELQNCNTVEQFATSIGLCNKCI